MISDLRSAEREVSRDGSGNGGDGRFDKIKFLETHDWVW